MSNASIALSRQVEFGLRGNLKETRADGTVILRNPEPLNSFPRRYTEKLEEWARKAPERTFLAQRTAAGGWQHVSYAEALSTVRALAQGLMDLGLSKDRPLAILSGNSIEHAMLALAALHVGIPYSPISVPYSLLSRDHEKLRHVMGLLEPKLVFAQSWEPFAKAISSAVRPGTPVLTVDGRHSEGLNYAALAATRAGLEVDKAFAAVNGDTLAKVLFTSGSSAMPKGVLNPHRMLCVNQQQSSQTWPFLQETPPVMLDWLPWNHTAGGNSSFGMNLYHGGTLYIDDGRPLPEQFEKTLRNLRDVAPTFYFGIPKVFELLLPELRRDQALRDKFFSQLQGILYLASPIPQQLWTDLRALTIEVTGGRIYTATTFGSTETGPGIIAANWDVDRPNVLGLPMPATEVKLVRNDRKTELRVRGPQITPGYLKEPAKTAAAFDEENFYSLGDAVRFADELDVDQGLMFDGRIAEDYKLSTGTWVNVVPLRNLVLSHLTPLVRDVIPAGHNRDELAILAFPEPEACRRLADLPSDTPLKEVARHPKVKAEFARRLAAIAAEGTSSVNTVKRLMIMDEPLTDAECTDKGTLSFSVVLERRAKDIDELYDAKPSARAVYAPSKVIA